MLATNIRPIALTHYAIPIVAVHLLGLFAFLPSFITWYNAILLVICVLFFGQGINLGYHRLLTHRSLVVPKWLEYSFVFLALCCVEETPAKWVSTHRKHHLYSDDSENDPHSPNAGFFWSHMGWLMFKRGGKNALDVEHRYTRDILKDPFYMALEKRWWLPSVLGLAQFAFFYAVAFAVFALLDHSVGNAGWNALGVAMWGVVVRIVVVWHITWSVNSLTHVSGYKMYDTGDRSRNNWLVSLLASGEGWHNNHHHDPASASVQHKWWEFDLTYYHIRVLEMLGLATRVVRPRHIRKRRRAGKDETVPAEAN
jgi:stearoyl-CoA desaturase (delta-9 desaturase)